jgi:hypothetical protein
MILLLSGLLMAWGTGAALAATGSGASPAQQQITLQQALSMAMTGNTSMNSQTAEVDQANNDLSTTQQENVTSLNFSPLGTSGSPSVVDPGVESAINSLATAGLNLQYQQRELQTAQDTVTYDVYQDYYAIVHDEATVNEAQQAYNLADLQERVTNLEYQVGSASQYAVTQEQQAEGAEKAALDNANTTLNSDYEKFNQLVGLASTARPELTDQPSFAPLDCTNLNGAVSQAIADSPSVLKAQYAISSDKTALSMVSDVPSDNMANEDTLNEDENSLAATEDGIDQSESNLYQTIASLESEQNSLEQTAAKDQSNLQIVEIECNIGTATKVDLQTAQSTLAQDQLALLGNTVTHQMDVMQFEKPWASGGSAGSATGSSASGSSGQ